MTRLEDSVNSTESGIADFQLGGDHHSVGWNGTTAAEAGGAPKARQNGTPKISSQHGPKIGHSRRRISSMTMEEYEHQCIRFIRRSNERPNRRSQRGRSTAPAANHKSTLEATMQPQGTLDRVSKIYKYYLCTLLPRDTYSI